jgi:hypothetical protein
MCIYKVTHPMRRKPIGKMHMTLAQAKRAALRAAKRPDLGFAHVEHWRDGCRFTVFYDGTVAGCGGMGSRTP